MVCHQGLESPFSGSPITPCCSQTHYQLRLLVTERFLCWVSCVGSVVSNPVDCSPPGSSVHSIFQARILEWVDTSFYRGSSQTRDPTHISCIGRWVLYHCTTWEAQKAIMCVFSVTKSCPTLCNPMECSKPCFPVLHYLLEFAQIHVH